jgi:hypothetical protein
MTMTIPYVFARAAIALGVGLFGQGCTTAGSPENTSVERIYVRQVYVTGSAVRHDVDPKTGQVDTPDCIYVLTPRQFGDSGLYRDIHEGAGVSPFR